MNTWLLIMLIFANDPAVEPMYVYKLFPSEQICEQQLLRAKVAFLSDTLTTPTEIRQHGRCIDISSGLKK